MGIQEVRGGEVAERRKVDRVERGTTETSFAIWRIEHWKRASWARASGIELLSLACRKQSLRRHALPSWCLDIWIALMSFDGVVALSEHNSCVGAYSAMIPRMEGNCVFLHGIDPG